MKIKTISILLVIASLGLISCKKDQTPAEKPSVSSGAAIETTQEQLVQPAQSVQPVQQPNQPGAVANTGAVPELNPAHGQPHHRCDVAVGAPLKGIASATQANTPPPTSSNSGNSFFNAAKNSAPNNSQQSQTIVAPKATPTPAKAQTVEASNTPKLATNPAHGQPHHRCDIAVGAPLT